MTAIRTTISLPVDVFEAGQSRKASKRKRNFSDYLQDLIEADCETAGTPLPPLAAAKPIKVKEVAR